MPEYETHDFDVVVVGAGGAGLRAAIEASARGARTALVCKSLLGKAHTVMAEGGIAAAMGNVYPEDNWQVHFRDTMRRGKMLNNCRMATRSPERWATGEKAGGSFYLEQRLSFSRPGASAGRSPSPRIRGNTRATATRSPTGPGLT